MSDGALLGFATDATIRVMKADLLKTNQTNYDDQASQLDYSPGWRHETNSSGQYQNTESWVSFRHLTEEQKKKTTVTAYFYGTGLEIKGFVDPGHGVYKVFLDGKEVTYQDGMGNASTIDGKKYFSGHAAQRQGDQTLVSLKGLDENLHAVTLQLDPDKNDLTKNIGMQVDQFITKGEGSELYSKAEILQSISKWKEDLSNFNPAGLKDTATARQAFKSNLDKLTAQLSSDTVNIQDVMSTVTTLQDILSKDENYQKPGDETSPEQPVEPKQPEQPEINYDKAMASLTEAIEKKVAELGTNNDAKKKLVEITDKAIAAIQEAKTQEDVNKALNNALEQIKQLQPSQPEQPVEPKQPEKPITSSSPEEGVKELIFQLPSLDIVKKAVPFKTIRRENPQLDKGKEQVLAEGKDGAIIEYIEVDGINRKVVQTESTPALDRVIEVGTKQSSVGTDTPPVVTLPEYLLPKEPEKPITSSSPEEGVKELVFQLPNLDIVKKAVPFKTIRHENPNLDKGKEKVLAEGKDGAIIEYVEVDGSNRKIVQTESTPALDRVIEVGTKQSSIGTEAPPVVTLPEYVLPRETEKTAPAVVTEDSPRKDEKAPVATTAKQDKEKQLPETGEQEANAFLFLAAITSVLSLLIFQKNFKD